MESNFYSQENSAKYASIYEFRTKQSRQKEYDKFYDLKEQYNKIKEQIDNAKNKTFLKKTLDNLNFLKKKKNCKRVITIAENLQNQTDLICKIKTEGLNEEVYALSGLRAKCVLTTIKDFIKFLDFIGQKTKSKEYEIPEELNVKKEDIIRMKQVQMSGEEYAKSTIAAAGCGAAAIFGVPSAVTATVGAFATASTGTAISSLSGAAATNATLAWLGGGSIASGGGGMAAGTIVLGTITGGVVIASVALVAGITATIHYSKKLTEAFNFFAEVGKKVTEIEEKLIIVNALITRIKEIYSLTYQLNELAKEKMSELIKIKTDFDINNKQHLKIFSIAASVIKTLSELIQLKVLDDNGDIITKEKITKIKNNIKDI